MEETKILGMKVKTDENLKDGEFRLENEDVYDHWLINILKRQLE